jgi:hypothetical protein
MKKHTIELILWFEEEQTLDDVEMGFLYPHLKHASFDWEVTDRLDVEDAS